MEALMYLGVERHLLEPNGLKTRQTCLNPPWGGECCLAKSDVFGCRQHTESHFE